MQLFIYWILYVKRSKSSNLSCPCYKYTLSPRVSVNSSLYTDSVFGQTSSKYFVVLLLNVVLFVSYLPVRLLWWNPRFTREDKGQCYQLYIEKYKTKQFVHASVNVENILLRFVYFSIWWSGSFVGLCCTVVNGLCFGISVHRFQRLSKIPTTIHGIAQCPQTCFNRPLSRTL